MTIRQFFLIDDNTAVVSTCKSSLPALSLVLFQNYVHYNRKDDIKEEAKEGLVPRAWQERKAKEKTAQFYPEYPKMVDFLFQKVFCKLIFIREPSMPTWKCKTSNRRYRWV